MDRRYMVASVIIFVVLCVATALYVQHTHIALLEPAGPIAFLERRVILLTFLLSGVVVIPVFLMLFSFAWKFHAEHPEAPVRHEPNWDHDSIAAEIIWWIIPSGIIAVLSVLAWQSSHALDPYKPLPGDAPPIEIQVVALDWKWLFMYPQEGVASVNVVEFPVGRAVHFTLTADAPMNTFWIPELAGQIMVMPGMSTQLFLRADKAGEYHGLSGNISGEGFAGMTFVARAVSASEYSAWVRNASLSTPLNSNGYEVLAAPSTYDQPRVYSLFSPALYDQIVMKYRSTHPRSAQAMDMPMTNATTTP